MNKYSSFIIIPEDSQMLKDASILWARYEVDCEFYESTLEAPNTWDRGKMLRNSKLTRRFIETLASNNGITEEIMNKARQYVCNGRFSDIYLKKIADQNTSWEKSTQQ